MRDTKEQAYRGPGYLGRPSRACGRTGSKTMNLDEYQERARATDQNPRSEDSAATPGGSRKDEVIPLLGMVGEVGGLLAEYKKLLRDGATHRRFRDEVAEELGDVLWYVANVATKFGLNLREVAEQNLAKVEDRWRS